MKWTTIALAIFVAGWFVFDGARALVVGDYVTPNAGAHAGQLGPWSKVVACVGIEPRSTSMKLVFLCYGIVWLVTIAGFILHLTWSWWVMLAMAVFSLWYLPFGTVLGVVQVVLLILLRLKT